LSNGASKNGYAGPLPPKLGLDTLWQIVVKIPSETAMKNASKLLLNAYAMIAMTEVNVLEQMLERVLSHLNEVKISVDGVTGDGTVSDQSLVCVDRLVGLLSGAILRSKGSAPAHIVKGSHMYSYI
jgi:hypothetical protein